jgi:hypothetical protein
VLLLKKSVKDMLEVVGRANGKGMVGERGGCNCSDASGGSSKDAVHEAWLSKLAGDQYLFLWIRHKDSIGAEIIKVLIAMYLRAFVIIERALLASFLKGL